MNTTATNRKIRELVTALRNKKLIPQPEFQRRLVWNNRDKSAFIDTVLKNFPFPEVYVASGDVDVETGEATELLVDGQQRITTLFQYFTNSPDLRLYDGIKPYSELSAKDKEDFLQYNVVVRDIGHVDMDVIKEVFRRINSTSYSLNAMEIRNSRFEGEYKNFGEEFSQRSFFENHRIFSASEIRRMQDIGFALIIITTAISTYFNREDELEEYLERYNDEFPIRKDIEHELDSVLEFIERMNMPETSRIWKRADLFTIIIEIHTSLFKRHENINPEITMKSLSDFYSLVDSIDISKDANSDQSRYYLATLQATNDRSSRILRGEIIRNRLIEPKIE
jgi:hypothetical protein